MKSLFIRITREVGLSGDLGSTFGTLYPIPLGSQGPAGGASGISQPPTFVWPNPLIVVNDYPIGPPPLFSIGFGATILGQRTASSTNLNPQPFGITSLDIYAGAGSGVVRNGVFYPMGNYARPQGDPVNPLLPVPLCFGANGQPYASEFFVASDPGNPISGAYQFMTSSHLKAPTVARGYDMAFSTVYNPSIVPSPIADADYYFGPAVLQSIAAIALDSQFLSNQQTAISDLVIIIPFGTTNLIIAPNDVASSVVGTAESSIGAFIIPVEALKRSVTQTVTLTHTTPQSAVAARPPYVTNTISQSYVVGQRHTCTASLLGLDPLIPSPSIAICDLGAGGGPL